MEIKRYLKKLEECPAEDLRKYHHIYDNYPFNLKPNVEEAKAILEKSDKFELSDSFEEGNYYYFNYVPGLILAHIRNHPWIEPDWKGSDKMREDYNSMICLHPDQEKDMKDITYKEARNFGSAKSSTAMLRAIKDLSGILIDNKTPFCLAWSHVPFPEDLSKNYHNTDYAKMAKFTPKEK
ncbi:MAG: hypothetical protein NTZ83_01220 [Candidatus Pacearchaeota archaeon]|nr:hypothetical protein [Candidatus Pacearchaeota archaeon]